MSSLKIGRSHKARKALFTRALRRGWLQLSEIDEALPSGSMIDAERWLLFYSLRAARDEVRDARGRSVDLQVHAGPRPAEVPPQRQAIDVALEAEEEGRRGDEHDEERRHRRAQALEREAEREQENGHEQNGHGQNGGAHDGDDDLAPALGPSHDGVDGGR